MDNKKISREINRITEENIAKLGFLFPDAVKDGEVDIEALKLCLGLDTEDSMQEKYELNWVGKKKAKIVAKEDIVGKTLKFIPEESEKSDATENIYIEGDNLEALKLIRQNYYGAIKLIYIDPPYNTGNDFVYNDNFTQSRQESDYDEGDIGDTGERFSINKNSGNRFHASWLSMMYPRLKMAFDLLREDGFIFISIDDNEVSNLKKLCDEIFGEENFLAQIVWQKRTSPDARKKLSTGHEYLLAYMKNASISEDVLNYSEITDSDVEKYSNPDNDPRGVWVSTDFGAQGYRPNQMYKIVTPGGKEYYPSEGRCWKNTEEVFLQLVKEGRMWFGSDGCGVPRKKLYLNEREGKSTWTWWGNSEVGHTQEATQQLTKIMGKKTIFDYPKPVRLIKRIIKLTTRENDLILDFFSGSATTAHATMEMNTDGLNRKFILIQLPEKIKEGTDAYNDGYRTICDIGKERMRRVAKSFESNNLDTGFKVFRVADTNIKWNSLMDMGQLDVSQIESTPDLMDFMPNTKDIDVVYELMLRQRDVALSESVELLSDIGNRTYLYASSFLVCLETEVTESLVEKIAAIDPLPIKFIFRDSAFKDDIALKDETFRRLKALVEKNSGESKSTYTVEFI